GHRPRMRVIVTAAAAFGLLEAGAALVPNLAVFLVLLAAMGFVNLVCQAMANASVQLSVDPELRGRVMGLYMLVFVGGPTIGAPILGAAPGHFALHRRERSSRGPAFHPLVGRVSSGSASTT